MSKFKVGDRVIYAGQDWATVVERVAEFDERHKITETYVTIHFDLSHVREYSEKFPYNWVEEFSLRKLTKLEKALQ